MLLWYSGLVLPTIYSSSSVLLSVANYYLHLFGRYKLFWIETTTQLFVAQCLSDDSPGYEKSL